MTTWTDEQLANYECALETIGNAIAVKARDIESERAKSAPDERRIEDLLCEQANLVNERNSLRIGDRDAIDRAIEQYGKLVRSNY